MGPWPTPSSRNRVAAEEAIADVRYAPTRGDSNFWRRTIYWPSLALPWPAARSTGASEYSSRLKLNVPPEIDPAKVRWPDLTANLPHSEIDLFGRFSLLRNGARSCRNPRASVQPSASYLASVSILLGHISISAGHNGFFVAGLRELTPVPMRIKQFQFRQFRLKCWPPYAQPGSQVALQTLLAEINLDPVAITEDRTVSGVNVNRNDGIETCFAALDFNATAVARDGAHDASLFNGSTLHVCVLQKMSH